MLWIITKHFACVISFLFGETKSICYCGEVVFVFKVNTYQKAFLRSLSCTNRHSIVTSAERSVITLVNMSARKYNWKGNWVVQFLPCIFFFFLATKKKSASFISFLIIHCNYEVRQSSALVPLATLVVQSNLHKRLLIQNTKKSFRNQSFTVGTFSNASPVSDRDLF